MNREILDERDYDQEHIAYMQPQDYSFGGFQKQASIEPLNIADDIISKHGSNMYD